ncbi:hypothetical protein LB504_003776 [Fusarium proliferatum]|nr:hypothetical protein LB504_003776 [Fusarium proliferatum]
MVTSPTKAIIIGAMWSHPLCINTVNPLSQSLMARDCANVVATLDFKIFFICAYSHSAKVTYKLCINCP